MLIACEFCGKDCANDFTQLTRVIYRYTGDKDIREEVWRKTACPNCAGKGLAAMLPWKDPSVTANPDNVNILPIK